MKYLFILLLSALSISGAPSVSLAWDPNNESDLAGYIRYYGSASRTYTNAFDVGNTTNCVVTNLVRGVTYYFAVTAYNMSGLESDYSNEVSYSVPNNTIVSVTLDISGAVTGQWTNVWSGMITNPVGQQFWRLIARREP